jgi:hypothetical protein
MSNVFHVENTVYSILIASREWNDPPERKVCQNATDSNDNGRIPATSNAVRWIISDDIRREMADNGIEVYANPSFRGPGPMSTFCIFDE